MWKLILKNIWSRRKQNGWLMAELVMVSIVTWIIIDPIVVLLHDTSLPMGYDYDRLCVMALEKKSEKAKGFDPEAQDDDALTILMKKLKDYPEIETVCPLSEPYLNSTGTSSTQFSKDTTSFSVFYTNFYQGTDFFNAYGIKAIPGSPDASELCKMDYAPNDIIITRSMAETFFPGESALNKTFYSHWKKDTTYYRIRGVVEDVRLRSTFRAASIAFRPVTFGNTYGSEYVLLRLKPRVSMKGFLNRFQTYMDEELKVGNWFVLNVSSYEKLNTDREYVSGVTNQIRLNTALAVFFLVNLCLGVIGTFWLQTRKRSEEAGIMRSFGATPGYILRMLLGEGVVLTGISVSTGCFIYLQYAMSEGLFQGYHRFVGPEVMMDYWVTGFATHFIGVSLIVFLIILCVVLTGIYIPARNISQVNPVDALRH